MFCSRGKIAYCWGMWSGCTSPFCEIFTQNTVGVSPDRQKVMVAGTTILDDDWGKSKGKIKEVCVEQG